MATNIKRHTQYYTGNGAPKAGDAFSSLNLYAHYFDRTAKKYYIYMGGGSWIVDPEYQITGSPTVTVGTTTTLPAGSQATVTDTDPSGNVNLNFGIPQGQAGSGGGSSATIVITPTGGDDTANLIAAIAQSKATRKPIEWYGRIKANQTLWIDKDFYNFKIISHGAELDITGHQGTGIKRVDPVDNNEALNLMVVAKWDIQGLKIIGNSNQIGIEPGPQYGGTISKNEFVGLKTGIHARFALFCDFEHNMYTNCYNGCLVDVGNWNGATNFNSQSNSARVSGRYYGNSAVMSAIREAFPDYKEQLMNKYLGVKTARGFDILSEIQAIANSSVSRVAAGGVAFGFYGVSGGLLHDYIVEGVSAAAAVDFDGLGSSVVKDFTIERGHIECVSGFSTANINLAIQGGEITINKQFGQYPALFLKGSSSSGLMYTEIAHVPWWIGQGGTGNGQGKCFDTSNMALHFEKNHAFNTLNSNMWVGTMPVAAGGDGKEGNTHANYHTYTINYVNPK